MRKNITYKKQKNVSFKDLIISDAKDYVFVNKPPFIASLSDRADSKNLLKLAREEFGDYQICHRLDKETSGIIVFSKNKEAYRNFAMQLENREVKKIYHAVIHGQHTFEDFEANEPLNITSTKSMVNFQSGKSAFTLLSTLELFKQYTLIKCFPVTGRMHQIRAHLAYHQAPIVQDTAYKGRAIYLSKLKKKYNHKKWEEENPIINRVALHSYQITFKGTNGEVIEERAHYPKDFSVLIKLLNKFN